MNFSLINKRALGFSLVLALAMGLPLSVHADELSIEDTKKEAVSAFRAKDFERAGDLFQDLYSRTNNANLLYNIGLCYYRSNKSAEAIKALEKFVQFVPGSSMVEKANAMITELRSSLTDDYIKVSVRTDPPDANVFLTERSGGTIGQTPYTIKLLPGSHVIIVDKPGYEVQRRTIAVSQEGSREVFFQLYPTSNMGAFKFMISEREAYVMVNKIRIGRSPIRDEYRLPNGEHEVLVMKPGYSTWREKVSVKAGESNVLQVDLMSDRVFANPDADGTIPHLWPYVTMRTGLLFAGGAAILGAQAQALHDKLESRAAQGILVHPSDKQTGNTWVMWTNVFSAVGAVALTGGATWWYLSDSPSGIESVQREERTPFEYGRMSFYGDEQ